jgi:hypothetical protein
MPRSGYDPASYDWSDEYYQVSLREIQDRTFEQRTFLPGPALVARQSHDGYREEIEYTGQAYDPAAYELVEGRWDHQHCEVCRFKVKTDHTYWQNRAGTIVCDACYDYIRSR